jgi:hypothetical protein
MASAPHGTKAWLNRASTTALTPRTPSRSAAAVATITPTPKPIADSANGPSSRQAAKRRR